MNDRDRELLKERLRSLANKPLGLRIITPQHWNVAGIVQPQRFFGHLGIVIRPGSTLYVEGLRIHPAAATFYMRHQTTQPLAVACGTIFPVPDFYHLQFSPELVSGILGLVARRPLPQLFTHIAGYHFDRFLFNFHDAFESDVLEISGDVPESEVSAFCRAVEASFTRKDTVAQTNPYHQLLDLLDHPERIKRHRPPWWRTIMDEVVSGFREGKQPRE